MSSNRNKLSFLSDLGKPTLRGLRKCPKCGFYNGSRGIFCKNKSCNAVFKDCFEKKKLSTANLSAIEAIKIDAGSLNSQSQVFSISTKAHEIVGGFVQLPHIPTLNPAGTLEDSVLLGQRIACCFVDSCVKSSSSATVTYKNIDYGLITLSAEVPTAAPCVHINAALNSFVQSEPLLVENSVLNDLLIPFEMKQTIWDFSAEISGAMVQRISKQMFVVKCNPCTKHPLGFLHVFFVESVNGKDHNKYRFVCQCKGIQQEIIENEKFCIHFYACLCAFASSEQLSSEFSSILEFHANLNDLDASLSQTMLFSNSPSSSTSTHFVSTVSNENDKLIVNGIEIAGEVEFLSSNSLLDSRTELSSDGNQSELILNGIHYAHKEKNKRDSHESFTVQLSSDDNSLPPIFSLADCSNLLMPDPESNEMVEINQTISKAPTITVSGKRANISNSGTGSPNKKNKIPSVIMELDDLEETSVSETFLDWLSGVTERINQTMHYQFSGNPDALVCYVSQTFFNCLQQRIANGAKKKRVPSTMTTFVQKNVLPLGTFTRFTWNITNVFHVKRIFDTPKVPLEVSRKFIQNRDGTFELSKIEEKKSRELMELTENFCKVNKSPLIKPVEFTTLIKVGIMSPTQNKPYPFIIEWVPDILPKSQIGELKIKFEYEHLKNGHLLDVKSLDSIIHGRTTFNELDNSTEKPAELLPR